MDSADQYRARLSQQGLDAEEIDTLVESKISKGELAGETGPDAILKAATAAVKEVFPEVIVKAEEEKDDEKDDDDEEEENLDKGEKGKMKAGTDASGRAPNQPEESREAEANSESDRAFNSEMSRYGKGHDDDDFDIMKGEEDYDLVAIISKGADNIVHDVRNQSETLAKGYMAVTDVVKSLSATTRENAAVISHLNEKIDALLKAIGQPVPPRSIIDAGDLQVIESPQDSVVKKSGFSAHDVIAKAHEELRAGTDANRAAELSMAVAMLESGADATEVAESAKLVLN